MGAQFGNRKNESDNGRHINFGSDRSSGIQGVNKYNNDREEPISGKNTYNAMTMNIRDRDS